jgi:CubicO group peptidase (beta-lactamase class C family)
VHDLLSMTAGMTNTWWHRVFEPSVYGVVPQLYKDAGVVDDLSAPATTLEENIKKLAQMPLIAHPGTMFDYSNNSVDTLCRLVEVVSGLDFDTYQRRTSSTHCRCTRPGSSPRTTSSTGSPPCTRRARTRR